MRVSYGEGSKGNKRSRIASWEVVCGREVVCNVRDSTDRLGALGSTYYLLLTTYHLLTYT